MQTQVSFSDLEYAAKKGSQWRLGMKAYIGVDAGSGQIHTVVATPANVADVTQAQAQLAGKRPTSLPMPATRGWTNATKSSSVTPM